MLCSTSNCSTPIDTFSLEVYGYSMCTTCCNMAQNRLLSGNAEERALGARFAIRRSKLQLRRLDEARKEAHLTKQRQYQALMSIQVRAAAATDERSAKKRRQLF